MPITNKDKRVDKVKQIINDNKLEGLSLQNIIDRE